MKVLLNSGPMAQLVNPRHGLTNIVVFRRKLILILLIQRDFSKW